MKTLTLEDLQEHLRTARDFRPFVTQPADIRDSLFKAENDDSPWRTRPTMFSTKLADRIHFRDSEVTVWAGYNGHRKSMFLGQVVADLLVQRRTVFVMSMEMTVRTTVERLARQMSGTDKPSPQWLDHFAAWSSGLWLLDYQGRIDPDVCLSACAWMSNSVFTPPHIVIDSLMMVVESEEHLDQQKQFVTDLVRFAKESGAHVHLVAHCRKPMRGGEDEPPTKYEVKGSSAITDQTDNVVVVWTNKPKHRKLEDDPLNQDLLNQPDVLVSVEKQRNGSWEGRVKLWHDQKSLRFCNDRVSPCEPYVMKAKDGQ